MDLTGIAAAAAPMTQSGNSDAVQMAVLKKAMDIQAQGASQLIQSATQVASNNPAHLGNRVDTFA
jgi:hypothetical protein